MRSNSTEGGTLYLTPKLNKTHQDLRQLAWQDWTRIRYHCTSGHRINQFFVLYSSTSNLHFSSPGKIEWPYQTTVLVWKCKKIFSSQNAAISLKPIHAHSCPFMPIHLNIQPNEKYEVDFCQWYLPWKRLAFIFLTLITTFQIVSDYL